MSKYLRTCFLDRLVLYMSQLIKSLVNLLNWSKDVGSIVSIPLDQFSIWIIVFINCDAYNMRVLKGQIVFYVSLLGVKIIFRFLKFSK